MKTVEDEISSTLEGIVSATTRRSLFNRLGGLATTPVHQLSSTDRRLILIELESSIRLFAPEESPGILAHCAQLLEQPFDDLRTLTVRREALPAKNLAPQLPQRFAVAQPEDVLRIRIETWDESIRLGFGNVRALQIAAAAAEMARSIVISAGRGTLELLADEEGDGGPVLEIVSRDDGPPPSHEARSTLRRLADHLHVDSRPGAGTLIVCRFVEERPAVAAHSGLHVARVLRRA